MIEISNRTKSQINLTAVKKAVESILLFYKQPKSYVSVVFIGDKLMQQLNKEWRHKDKVTDVLSFRSDDSEFIEADFLGELFIDFKQIERQAKELNHSVKYELIFITVHGVLHLLGHNDDTDAESKAMLALGEKLIKKFSLA